jgi:hypothetical protein
MELEKGDVIYVAIVRKAGFGPNHYGIYIFVTKLQAKD